MSNPGTQSSEVSVAGGRLAGTWTGRLHRFAAIPYAAPPVGPLRFRAPQPPQEWHGVRPASDFGPVAIQGQQPPSPTAHFGSYPMSEDCLTLNVWTPELGDARLPVSVYIHGGGLVALSGRDPMWHGDTFATEGIVHVTINYRLGVFGFLSLGELVAGLEESGTNGLLDQIAALRWVRDNIAAFGGDPDQVTVLGQSAGGWSVSNLLGSPLAAGLCRRAIIQSGGGHHVHRPDTATRVARKALELAGVEPDLDQLLTLPAEQLYAAQEGVQRLLRQGSPEALDILGSDAPLLMSFLPVGQSAALPELPYQALASGAAAEVDLLAGGCRDEYGLYRLIGSQYTPEQMLGNGREQLAAAGRDPDEARRRYAANRPGVDEQLTAEAVENDRFYRVPVIRMAENHQGRTFMYELAYSDSPYGATHCLDLVFVYDRPDCNLARDLMPHGTPLGLVSIVKGAWLSFIRTGDPSTSRLPAWPEYDRSSRSTMVFDHPDCSLEVDPRGDEREVWDGVI
jgi:para-nitrobenzyl esterase